MKYVAAYMLAVLGGNESPKAADLKAILKSVEATVDDAAVDKVVSELSGKKIDDLIKEGAAKLATVAVAAAPAAAAPGGAAPAAGGKADKPAEKKKEEAPAEEEDMGFSLFD